ncbi:carboxylating nicotinate-nucleotide diphosphorylase [Peptoniphilus sp. KCTC 25270]|uniref:carboxylating nicotinate-nucleotide diphosphorylase n=1 Tax=Peptoniphilus sp. KCTC 25270 TaxID=2897414 RepID=UPI001E433153|nr:carboxylating nicotinate-nucleotide diphosphorylase [Peptoniphilus sp. KCTC 25270]MCD1146668.1 carboxylating nicotinate-nucleotide diphosphorylase [Peptoniphilus sp. KCTC 25270]
MGLSPLQMDSYLLSALEEDINGEDVTTQSVVSPTDFGEVKLLCKEDGVLAGIDVFQRVFTLFDSRTTFKMHFQDGDPICKGDCIGMVYGSIQTLLSAERVALNFLQRMSGIATYTRSMVEELEGSVTQIVDTRKTTPNLRIFEKYAVRVGGGKNHRYNLTDGVLLKDNHIGAAGSVKNAIEMARNYAPFVRKIEIEVENLEMVKEALEAKADIIMLDNMTVPEIQEALELIQGKALVELSGNISKENISQYKDLGADCISMGALTHSAPILDFSLKELRKSDEIKR